MGARLKLFGNAMAGQVMKYLSSAGIAVSSRYNRLNVLIQQPAGAYQPGVFA